MAAPAQPPGPRSRSARTADSRLLILDAAVACLVDRPALVEVACRGDVEVASRALARLTGDADLRAVAVATERDEIACAAAGRLGDRDELAVVASEARSRAAPA